MTTIDLILIVLAAVAVGVLVVALVASPKARDWLLGVSGALLAGAGLYLLGRMQNDSENVKRGEYDRPDTRPPLEDARAREVDIARARDAYPPPNFRIIEGKGSRTERLENAAKGRRDDSL